MAAIFNRNGSKIATFFYSRQGGCFFYQRVGKVQQPVENVRGGGGRKF